ISFDVQVPEGGTAPATLYVMNDDRNLYVALHLSRAVVDPAKSFNLEFDNNDDCVRANGDEVVVMNPDLGTFDEFRTDEPPCPPGDGPARCGFADTDAGGTNDARGAFGNDGTSTVYEISHLLSSGDTAHDFSLAAGDDVGLFVFLRMIDSANRFGDTTFPDAGSLRTHLGRAPGPCPLRPASRAPEWLAGRYFPRFPAIGHSMFVLPVRTPLLDQSTSWQGGWRISDSADAMAALTL